jgi:hypothetical protein
MPSSRECNASTHFASEVRENPKLRRSLSSTQICAIDDGGPATGSRLRDHGGSAMGSSAQRQLTSALGSSAGGGACRSAPPLAGPRLDVASPPHRGWPGCRLDVASPRHRSPIRATMASPVPAGGRAAAQRLPPSVTKGMSVDPRGEVEGEATVDLLQGRSLAGAAARFCCP